MRRLPSQGLTEQLCVVGDDAVHPEVAEAAHVRRIVDGPDEDLLSRSFYSLHQPRFNQSLMGNHVLDRKFAPQALLGFELTDQAEWNAGVQGIDGFQHSGDKG